LHDLGVFLHFQDDPLLRNTVILQNRWATEAVFRILDDETVKACSGRFSAADCTRVWAESEYADMHPELLALMEKFELCYPLPDLPKNRTRTWLAPQLLTPSAPSELTDWAAPGDLVLSYRYRFLPKGLVNRLMVRKHQFVQHPEMAWATGVLFDRDSSSLLAQVMPRGNEIALRARGSESKALLSVIATELDELNASFSGLEEKLEKLIPCNCKQCIASTTPEMFEQKRLLKRKQDGKLSVECPASYEDVNVLILLDGFRPEHLSRWMEKPSQDHSQATNLSASDSVTKSKTIKIFLASSKELREDRDEFDLYFRQQNDQYRKKGIYLEIVRWENFLDAMSSNRLQDEYNREVRTCDIFVSLFETKTGSYTEEEFDVAHQAFKKNGKPRIYTYFKQTSISPTDANREALKSLWDFQDKLKAMEHFPTEYKNTEHLKQHFKDQLEKLLDD
jgi:internalin A